MKQERNSFFDYLLIAGKWIVSGAIAMWVAIPSSVHVLILSMGLDFATGLLCGFILQTLCSETSFKGLARKAMVLIMVGAAHLLSAAMQLPYDLGSVVAWAYIISEIISITENCARVGIPIPPVMLNALLKVKNLTGRQDHDVINELEAADKPAPENQPPA